MFEVVRTVVTCQSIAPHAEHQSCFLVSNILIITVTVIILLKTFNLHFIPPPLCLKVLPMLNVLRPRGDILRPKGGIK